MPTAPPSAPAAPPAAPSSPGITSAPAPVSVSAGKWQTGAAKPKPIRAIINGVEGIGKTTIAAHAPGAAVIMARGETGYETLLGSDRVPSVPYMLISDWLQLIETIRNTVKDPGEIKTLVLDALGGFERLCHEYVCRTEYSGDWGPKGFANYQEGYGVALKEWLKLIHALDSCHEAGIGIIMLSHVAVKQFDNPEGPSYTRYETACHKKTWAETHKWADTVLFYNFKQALHTEQNKKVHGLTTGGRTRVIYTERSDAYDAKNRYGMPNTIQIPSDHTKAWAELAKHIPYYR